MSEQNFVQPEGTEKTGSPKKVWMIVLFVSLAVLLIGAGCVTGVVIHQNKEKERAFQQQVDETVNRETFYDGIVVQGVQLGGKTKEQAQDLLAAEVEKLKKPVNIKAVWQGKEFQFNQDGCVYTDNLDEVLEEAYAVCRSGERMDRYEQILALQESPKNFSLEVKMEPDAQKVSAFVDDIVAQCAVEAHEAKVTRFDPLVQEKFTYEEGSSGVEVDRDALTQKVEALLASENKVGSFDVPTRETQPTVTVEDLKQRTVLISQYSTTSTNTEDGNSNMRLALAAVNGTVVEPDGIFSFNNLTGDTNDPSRGYKLAGALVGGQNVPQYGGGICQVSTTLYGAAMRADMDITMRYNHALPSSYVPLGQDATVDYPNLDFQFRNSSAYPIYIAAWMTGTVLHVELYGYQPEEWDTIEVTSWKTETIPQPADEYVVDETLAPGTQKLKSRGHVGSKAEGERTYYKNGQKVKVDPIHSSSYGAKATVYLVGPSA